MFYQYNHLGSPDYLKIEKNENFSFPPHLHQCFEIICILSGEMKITVDGREFVLKADQALLIFPNQIHSLESKKSRHILCIFSPGLVQAYSTRVAGKIPADNSFVPDEYLVKALDKLAGASTIEKKGVLYSLCGQFDRCAEYAEKESDRKNLLYRIFSFVEGNFGGDCSLADLARETGYDYAYLSRYFKKATGISFNFYVNHYRLSNACYLMDNTDLPIIQCALDSGFTSLRSFNRSFKEYLKVTPTQYRKDQRNGGSVLER